MRDASRQGPDDVSLAAAILAFIALLLGLSIYVLLRPATTWLHAFAMSTHLWPVIDGWRPVTAGLAPHIPLWAIYNLPNALWSMSWGLLASSICMTSSKHNMVEGILWIWLMPTIGVCFEIGQYHRIIPGTFDSCDIIAHILAGAGVSLFHVRRTRRR